VVEHLASLVPDCPHSDARLEVRAPFDHALLATVELSGRATVEHALETARMTFNRRGEWLSRARRIAVLQKTAQLLGERAEAFALEASREGGKPLVDSRVEVARAIDGLHNAAAMLRTEAGHVVPMGLNAASMDRIAFTQTEPVGVVAAVSAFNHPLNLIVHQVAPAVAAGCPVIVKPAEATPMSCFRLVSLLREAGLPDGWCQALVTEDRETTARLVTDPRIAYFSFVGSAAVGWHLRSLLAPGTRCALEHGGVAPVIVAADADLASALPRLAKGAFYHAGQVCVSVQRIFVHRSIVHRVAEGLATLANHLIVGDPTLSDTEVGPLIRPQEVERVHAWVQEAVAGGAKLICGGEPLSQSCYRPTMLLEPPQSVKLSQQEVFGPVACVYAYDELDDAISRANHPNFSFHAAIFTSDLNTAFRAYKLLDASAVIVNDHTAFRLDWMPFAGLRRSGLGVGGIPYTFREMQFEKMFVGVTA
jgi:acyl-CoA reductase-like NAD-dependent aldehyde dehydrogenase